MNFTGECTPLNAQFSLKRPIWPLLDCHDVPLSAEAMAVLRRRWPLRASNDGLVFSTKGKKPLSDMTMTKVLRDLSIPKITVHGFRSSFTDWAAEMTELSKEVVDKALAHKLVDRVEAAYRRTDFFERRRQLMRTWAEYASHCVTTFKPSTAETQPQYLYRECWPLPRI